MEELAERCFRESTLLASHDAGQIEREMAVCLWENTSLKKQKGFMDGPPIPLAANLTRSTSPLMGEAGVLLLLHKGDHKFIRISHPTKEGH